MVTGQIDKTIKRVKRKVNNLKRKPYGPNSVSTNLKPRAILKDGDYNIIQPKFRWRYLHYVRDTFTSLVDAEWKWTIQVMVLGFTGCWISFALLWWLIAFVHKDLHDEHLPPMQSDNGWTPCVLNIYGFHSCFLYSLETQSTIGYGSRAITEECPEAIFLMCAQCIIGTFIDSFTVGVLFAKLTRPRLTAYTVQFSKNAVVCLRDEEYCMMLRIGDLRKSHLISSSVKAFLIHTKVTKEGENLNDFETELEVQCDDSGSDPLLLWPITVIHKISENSPFYNFSASEMLNEKFEIIVILDGTIESTGQNTHAKSSYLENEVLWGHTFENMLYYNDEMESYEINYKYFDKLKTFPMPICSAAEFDKIQNETSKQSDLILLKQPGKIERTKKHLRILEDNINNSMRSISFGNIQEYQENSHEIISEPTHQKRSSTPPFPVDWV
ncbi:G protein-activated inward rectifier potassium channel 3 [Diabrotica virgifera virgifera]|uniref:G protein-activated inward rectifier potassium channel 3-like n=1 Tax=Diabrotica virgifera virgifera TaxID=50390 RepID=A0A6P7FMW0_DIAVI|nr:G protein-activated inward rectifier potassium channel 3 [Diabrotica virgifera virgifera]